MRRNQETYDAILAQIAELNEELNELDPDERELFEDYLGDWCDTEELYICLERLPDEQ